ncbi:unnamed protein product [Pleuronectes platessa]|uniref:Uncharacterized protein n=1 Tax=Pleuronectes platessa TaxID=8262 RepID=A0A9N7Y5W6_PLEPL|nr:unnamed protein product [Pleuronectes platessa]
MSPSLLDNEEKLRSRILEQEANFQQVEDQLHQMTETKEEVSAELEATDDSKEVRKERKEKKKLERKEQLEREKKEKEENLALMKREKEEKEEEKNVLHHAVQIHFAAWELFIKRNPDVRAPPSVFAAQGTCGHVEAEPGSLSPASVAHPRLWMQMFPVDRDWMFVPRGLQRSGADGPGDRRRAPRPLGLITGLFDQRLARPGAH